MLASTQTSLGLCSSRMRWPACDVFARQHEGAVDHRRHRAADRAVLDVDVLLGELGREVGHLVVECGDLRVDHAQPVKFDPRLVEAAFGLLVFGLELQDLAFELRHRGLGLLELALAGHASLEQRPVAFEFQPRQVEIGLERGQRLFARRDRGRARAHLRIGLVLVETPLGPQPGALGPDALDLRAQGIGAELGHAIVDAGHHLAGRHARSLQRRHLHHPALGAAGDGHDVGGGARIVFVDVREPQVELAAAIGDCRQQHGGNGQEPRAERQADAAAGQDRAARQDADRRLRNVKRRRAPYRSLKRAGGPTDPRG